MLGSSKMFKLVKNDTHWLAFGVSETLIVAQAVDLKKLKHRGPSHLDLHISIDL